MHRAHTAWIAAGLAAIFIGTPARSRPTLDSWDWATVGDPGNRGTTDDENGVYFTDQTVIGGVDSRYRMAVTEVTVGQYIGFAQDYASLYRERTGNFGGFSDFTGGDFILQGGNATARINPGVSANQPIQVGWEYAARFTNWLHNGGGTEARIFDQGRVRHEHLHPEPGRLVEPHAEPRRGRQRAYGDARRVDQGRILGPQQERRRGGLLALQPRLG